MLIRKAKVTEIEQICRIEVAAFVNSPYGEKSGLVSNKSMQRQRWDSAKHYCEIHLDWHLVAVEDNQVVGFCALEYWAKERAGSIQNNAVLSEYRNRGISTELVRETVKELKRLGTKYITVRTRQCPAACRVYEKANFKLSRQDGELRCYELHL